VIEVIAERGLAEEPDLLAAAAGLGARNRDHVGAEVQTMHDDLPLVCAWYLACVCARLRLRRHRRAPALERRGSQAMEMKSLARKRDYEHFEPDFEPPEPCFEPSFEPPEP